MFGTIFGRNALRARRTPSSACCVASRWFAARSLCASASVTACSGVSTAGICAAAGAPIGSSIAATTKTRRLILILGSYWRVIWLTVARPRLFVVTVSWRRVLLNAAPWPSNTSGDERPQNVRYISLTRQLAGAGHDPRTRREHVERGLVEGPDAA